MHEPFFSVHFTLMVWVACVAVLVMRAWYSHTPVAGLSIGFAINLATIHVLNEVANLLGESLVDPVVRSTSEAGFRLSSWAVLGYIGGQLLVWLYLRAVPLVVSEAGTINYMFHRSLVFRAILTGVILNVLVVRLFRFVPSVTAILSGGMALASVGLCWWYLTMLRKNEPIRALLIAAVSGVFPVITVLNAGFMGYGIAAVITVGCFVVANHKPRRVLAVIVPLALFLGLSLYPSYLESRENIRRSVWGNQSFLDRVTTTTETLSTNWRWFNWNDPHQVELLNARLNQNLLVGAAYRNISQGDVRLLYGETLRNALLALVPRIIWPDKPSFAGSNQLVSRMTGIRFAPGTSVGIGVIMEIYVNFGETGLFCGFVMAGLVLAYIDHRCGVAMNSGNYGKFFLSFVPGIALLNVGGVLAETTASFAGFAILTWIFLRFLAPLKYTALYDNRVGERPA